MENATRRRRSSLPYLLLNILISALTTLLVLWLWSKAQVNKMPDQFNNANGFPPAILQPTNEIKQIIPPPLPPTDIEVIQITNVFGAGDLANEVVVIQNISDQTEIWLDNWKLEDEDGNTFEFQSLVLNKGAEVQIFTHAGHNTVNSLFWNLNEAVWQTGEAITIYDYANNLRAAFTVPKTELMNIFEIIAEQRIREAIENGDVTGLPGEGKPIKWQQNPFRPEGMGIVFDLLQNNGFTLPWIEKAREIQSEAEKLRRQIKSMYKTGENEMDNSAKLKELADWCQQINKKIMDYNMSVPLECVQIDFLKLDKEFDTAYKSFD